MHCVIKKCIFYNVYKITHGCFIAITVIYVNTHTHIIYTYIYIWILNIICVLCTCVYNIIICNKIVFLL